MRQNSRITGRRICAVVALAMVIAWGIPALAPTALADSTVASAAATRSTPHSPQVHHPRSYENCTSILEDFGYEATPARTFACEFADAYPNAVYGVSVCMGALWVTGVPLIIAMPACGAGAVPQFAETEFCYYSGGFACLNAWSGGPYVNVYTGGPETTDTHADFAVFANPGTGYAEIGFTGTGSWSGECIGDASNNSGDADVSLDSCGSSSGGQGWGTNFTWGTDGCPSGEAWFKDVHWNGYLGPPDGYVNGSHFYLNKPGLLCFSYTLEAP